MRFVSLKPSVCFLFSLFLLLFIPTNAFPAIRALTTQQPPRPNDCTYWVTKSLLAGEYPTDMFGDSYQKLRNYLDVAGITYFVDLTEKKYSYVDMLQEVAADMKLSRDIQYKQCAIPDFGVPSKEFMKEILDTIDEAIESNHKVYVHCRGGIGRTGTTVGCYLARHGYTGEEALEEVNRLFQFSDRSTESSHSPETPEQESLVRNWQE